MPWLGMQSQNKKFWVDIEVEQSFGLKDWFRNSDLNNAMRKSTSTDLKGRLNWEFRKNIGVYTDLSVCLNSYDKNHRPINIFNELDLNNYYVKNEWFRDNNNQNPGVRLTFGVFYKFNVNKINLIPHLGIGFEDTAIPRGSYTLKEKGTNTMYNVDYIWFPNNSNVSGTIGILSFQLISSYRISKMTSLIFGVNYRYNLTRPDFTARISDYYDKTVINEINVKGNNIHSLGVSVGVSFGR